MDTVDKIIVAVSFVYVAFMLYYTIKEGKVLNQIDAQRELDKLQNKDL